MPSRQGRVGMQRECVRSPNGRLVRFDGVQQFDVQRMQSDRKGRIQSQPVHCGCDQASHIKLVRLDRTKHQLARNGDGQLHSQLLELFERLPAHLFCFVHTLFHRPEQGLQLLAGSGPGLFVNVRFSRNGRPRISSGGYRTC